MAANNAFEADGPKSVASAISVFPPLRSWPPAQGERRADASRRLNSPTDAADPRGC